MHYSPQGDSAIKRQIERVVRTFGTQLVPRLSASTGHAVLKEDEFWPSLVRYNVDIYHNSPHADLDGETPLNRWGRLVEEFGVQPRVNPEATSVRKPVE